MLAVSVTKAVSLYETMKSTVCPLAGLSGTFEGTSVLSVGQLL